MEAVARGEPAPIEEAFIAGYLQASEYVEQPETEASSGAAAAGATPLGTIATHIDLLYEEQILAEQAAISRRVAEDLHKAAEPAVSKKGEASKKGKAQTATVAITASTETFSEEKAALRREILSKLKERGRTKWRTLARVLITALKSAHDNKTITVKVIEKGSHFMIHAEGEAASDGATIIRPHGKLDRTLAAGEARGLAENLIDLTFRLMARKP